jgi:hypothetical protein
MRKALAVLFTIITCFAIKETVYVFSATNAEIGGQRGLMIIVWISITLPLFLFSLWLWKPRPPEQEN